MNDTRPAETTMPAATGATPPDAVDAAGGAGVSGTEPQAPPARILVVDDEESMRHFVARALRRHGYEVEAVADGDAAIAAFAARPSDLTVVDLKMPGTDGLEVLRRLRHADPEAAVVLMTGYATVDSAVQAMQLGAVDYVAKPFDAEELVLRVRRALEHRRVHAENRNLRRLLGEQLGYGGLLGRSPAMREVFRSIDLLRDSTSTVLITGESGTGKGVVARALHLTSERAAGPFVALHCSALPPNLLESELFGYEPGAFTGATKRKPGLLAKAHGGTLFLDEVAEITLAAQAKLERFLQEREFLPLGGMEPVTVDVRVLAATNRDLAAAVRDGSFRSELYWRLDVVRVHVPPLRDRPEDVPLLAMHWLRHIAARERVAVEGFTDAAMQALCGYAWPGNVRELQNLVERMVVMAGGARLLDAEALPSAVRDAPSSPETAATWREAVTAFERRWFIALLQRVGGNVSEAARVAGVSRGHLHRRAKDLGIDLGSLR